MKKEQEFHELIEQQDEQNKKRLWNKIKNGFDDSVAVDAQSSDVLAMKTSSLISKRNITIVISLILVVLISITGILIWKLMPSNKTVRYCKMDEYFAEETTQTIKQYAQEKSRNILYFDYYNEWDYIGGLQYKLNDTSEVICLQEDIIDANGIILTYYVTDNLTDIDFLEAFKTACRQSEQIMSTTIYWHETNQEGNAWFEYKGFKYYIKAQGEFSPGYILELVQLLIDNNK